MKPLRKTFEQKTPLSPQIDAKSPPAPDVAVRLHTVGSEEAGQRIDNFLIRVCKGVPKSWVYRVVRKGEVRVNKGRVDVEYKLQTGDVVRIPPVRVAVSQTAVVPTSKATKLPVIYEDDALLIIDKPAGLAVHGGSGVSFGVIEQLRAAYPQFKFLELAHRLDKETSGLLMLAKKRSVLVALHEIIRNGQMDKRYYAILHGNVAQTETVVRAPLYKFVAANGDRRVVVSETGQTAHSRFNVDQRLNGYTAAHVKIYTGRTHQIRVHAAHIGHFIIGDDKYGDFELNRRLAKQKHDRMFLHAHALRLDHPVTGEVLDLIAPIPESFRRFIAAHQLPSA